METNETIERSFIGSCLLDPRWIDNAITQELKPEAFDTLLRRKIWEVLMDYRLRSWDCTTHDLIVKSKWSAANRTNLATELFECEKAAPTTAQADYALKELIWAWKRRRLIPAITDVREKVEKAFPREDISKAIETVVQISSEKEHLDQSLEHIADQEEEWARAQISGVKSNVVEVTTGIPCFDRHATPIMPYEYVVVGARTSTGKTSLMEQIAGHNLRRGLRVAYFTIESSSRSILRQMAAQYAKVDMRHFMGELRERQAAYFDAIKELRNKPLIILDRDLSLPQIQSKCRMLASSFKPNLVVLDYMNIIGTKDSDSYEKISSLSEAMIPLCKSVNCTLMVGAQLNRGNEKENRRPERTDFRDSGSVEEDAHRLIALYRPSKGFNGMVQEYDQNIFDYEIIQLKLRDGPTCAARIKFNAPHTTFYEEIDPKTV